MSINPEIHRTVRAISITLDEAIAFYETYVVSARDAALIKAVNQSGIHPAFNVISDALHREVILGLCRIWDRRPDTANLNKLASEFRSKAVRADLERTGHIADPDALNRWCAGVANGSKSEELSALKRARDRALAHTATPNQPYKGRARVAQYGAERKVLELTTPLVEQAAQFIGYSYLSPFADRRLMWQRYAGLFWRRVDGSA